MEDGEIKPSGGIEYSNVVLEPDKMRAWYTNPKGVFKSDGIKAYLVDPAVPHVLVVREDDYKRTVDSQDVKQHIAELGLPGDWLYTQTKVLGELTITKWMTGFDEARGSVMIFLFGLFGGIVIGAILLLIFFMILGAVN